MIAARNATTRLVVAHFVAVAIAVALVLGLMAWSARGLIDAEVREVVEAEVKGLEEAYRAGGLRGLAAAIERRAGNPTNRDGVYLLTDPQGQRITGNLSGWPVDAADRGWLTLRLTRTDTGAPAQISAAALSLSDGERLLVGRDARARTRFEQRLLTAAAWAIGLTAALALATGWGLSRLVLRRIDETTATARRIADGDLDRRVPLDGTGDEFDRLADALNAMLDRIEGLVGGLRMVTDSVAHDLRSPLTRLRGALESALTETDDAERAALLARATDEADHTLQMLSGLLGIARAEAGVGREQFQTVDLDQLAADAAELYGPVAEERGLTLDVDADEGATVTGHPQLLAQALSNLIENALAHAPDGTAVSVSARAARPARNAGAAPKAGAVLCVADRGPGIPETDRTRVLERFVRLDPSRSGPGTGLGLSMVAAIARLHGARLTLDDNAPGLRVRLAFAAPQPASG